MSDCVGSVSRRIVISDVLTFEHYRRQELNPERW